VTALRPEVPKRQFMRVLSLAARYNHGFSVQVSGVRKREPQNTEQKIMNVEEKENFIIRNSLFDIRYSKDEI
jgi:hypothetical protein